MSDLGVQQAINEEEGGATEENTPTNTWQDVISVHTKFWSRCREVLHKDDTSEQHGDEIPGGEAEVGGCLYCIVATTKQQEAEGQREDHTHHCGCSDVGQGMGGEARLQPASMGGGGTEDTNRWATIRKRNLGLGSVHTKGCPYIRSGLVPLLKWQLVSEWSSVVVCRQCWRLLSLAVDYNRGTGN